MKSRLIKFLPVLLVIFILSACSGFAEESFSDITSSGEPYPSQFLNGDVYILENGEKILGNISGVGTTLVIEDGATVIGDISLLASNLEVYGKVQGNINLFAGTSSFFENSVITGSINQIFNQLETSPGAIINGEINTYVFPTSGESNFGKGLVNIMEWFKPTFWFGLQFARILMLVLFSVLAVYIFKDPTFRVEQAIRKNPAVSWGAGIITLFFVPLISLVLIVTICLSPVGIIFALAILIGSLWGWTALSGIVGDQFSHWAKIDSSDVAASAIGAVIIGIIISLISLIPCVGFVINLTISALGLGGVLLSRFGTLDS